METPTRTLQQETPKAVPTWYILSEDFLLESDEYNTALDIIGEFLSIETQDIEASLADWRIPKIGKTRMKLVELLVDQNIVSHPYRNTLTDGSQIKLSKGGEVMLSKELLLEYLDSSEISPLVDNCTLEEYDPDAIIKDLIYQAFAAVLLYPDDYWEERGEEISGFPDTVKNDILATQDMVDQDINYPQFKIIRRIVLQHLEII